MHMNLITLLNTTWHITRIAKKCKFIGKGAKFTEKSAKFTHKNVQNLQKIVQNLQRKSLKFATQLKNLEKKCKFYRKCVHNKYFYSFVKSRCLLNALCLYGIVCALRNSRILSPWMKLTRRGLLVHHNTLSILSAWWKNC